MTQFILLKWNQKLMISECSYIGTGCPQVVEADGTDIVDLDRVADGVERGDFVDGRPPAGERVPADASLAP